MGSSRSSEAVDADTVDARRHPLKVIRNLSELRSRVPCEVIGPDDKAYAKARQMVWNFDTMGEPAALIRCTTTEDVVAAVKFAAEHKIEVCVRSAGAHSAHAVVDECLVIDLSLMRTVTVSTAARTAEVAGGALIGDVDDACERACLALPMGCLALPMGHVYHTGVAGMLLNATSGIGYLSRTRGLCGSYLSEATVVTADGRVLVCNSSENAELFWALPGAGSNMGIATRFVFRLSVVSPVVIGGDVVQFPKNEGPPLRNSRKSRYDLVMPWVEWFAGQAPDEVSALIIIACKGPVVARSFYIPAEDVAAEGVFTVGCLGGLKTTTPKAEEYLAHIKSTGRALMNTVKARKYHANVQKMGKFKPSHYYQKAVFASALPPDAVQGLCDAAARCPVCNQGTAIILQPLLGQQLVNLKEDELPTAQMLRQVHYWIIIIAEFPKGPKDAKLRERCVDWVRATYAIVDPYAIKDPPEFGRSNDWRTATDTYGDIYGTNTRRLQELKQKYDPGNFFQKNRNIVPFTAQGQ